MQNKYLSLAIFIFLFTISGYSNPKDSLKKVVKETSNGEKKAKALFEIGEIEYDQKNYSKALKKIKEAGEYVDDEAETILNCKINLLTGKIYHAIYSNEEALKYDLRALKIAEKIKANKQRIQILIEIGLINADIDNLPAALNYFQQAKKLNEQHLKNPTSLLSINLNRYIGIIYGQQGEFVTSINYTQKAYKACLQNKNCSEEDLSGLINNIGVCYFFIKQYDKAFLFYQKAYDRCVQKNDPKTMGNICSNLGEVYIMKKDFAKAKEFLNKALDYKKKVEDPKELLGVYDNLSDLYTETGDYKNALMFRNLFMLQKEKVNKASLVNKISELKNQYEIEKIENEYEVKEQKRQFKIQLLIIGIALLLVIAFLVFRNLRIKVKNTQLEKDKLENEQKLLEKEIKIKNNEIENFAKRIVEKNEFMDAIQDQLQRIESELDYKNKELETFALTLVEKNDFLEKVKEKIADIQRSQQNNDSIREISNLIKTNLYIEKDREEFEAKLENIQSSFLFKLENRFPDLTKTEKRLSSLLVMGMSSKEIATLMNISPDGVKKSRFRLRKKLELDTEQDVTEFLRKI